MTSVSDCAEDEWNSLLELLGEHAMIVHAPISGSGLSGTDYDCVVVDPDESWPLRLKDGWSLSQRVHYDLLDWYCVLERDGQILLLDTVSDPDGLGRDGFPMKQFVRDGVVDAAPVIRAAYLTAKRVHKRMAQTAEWQRIGTLANDNPSAYREALSPFLGARLAERVASAALQGRPPDPPILRRAFWALVLRRFRTPSRAFRIFGLASRRATERVLHPVGMMVLVAGPDGAGKSSLAQQLPEACFGVFHRWRHAHWRPGLLPRPGALLGRAEPDPAEPHARPVHGRAVSVLLLLYYWTDFVVGSWTLFAMTRVRFGLVILERGWWDIEADSRRYRLDAPPALVRLLGRALPRPDVALILEAPARTLRARKLELDSRELERQAGYWRTWSHAKLATSHIDVGRSPSDVVALARAAIGSAMERRTAARVGAGWMNVPSRRRTRWYLPRGPRNSAVSGLLVYQPVTDLSRGGWRAARAVAQGGGFRMWRRGEAPPREVRARIGAFVPPHGNIAVMRTAREDRYIVAILDHEGTPRLLAKVATDEASAQKVDAEVAALERVAQLLNMPLQAPRLVAHEPGLAVFDFVRWLPRRDPVAIPEDVAFALGRFYRASARGRKTGAMHGDFAPWNVLQTIDGWTLVDWEDAAPDGPPFADLCHFYVQSHTLLRRPSEDRIVSGFCRGTGAIGSVLRAYADGAELDVHLAEDALRSYLSTSEFTLLPEDRARGARSRQRLLRRIEG